MLAFVNMASVGLKKMSEAAYCVGGKPEQGSLAFASRRPASWHFPSGFGVHHEGIYTETDWGGGGAVIFVDAVEVEEGGCPKP